jgi:hypothetical protein
MIILLNVLWGESIKEDELKNKIIRYKRNFKDGIEYPAANILIQDVLYRGDYLVEVYYDIDENLRA